MTKQITENVLFIVGIILYNVFFWKEQMGLNTLLFSLFILGSVFYLNPESRHSTIARLTALTTIFTAIMVVVFNSQFSKVIHILSLVATVGFVQQRELRFLWYAVLLMLQSTFSVPIRFFQKLKAIKFGDNKTIWHISRYVRLAILPMLFVIIFFSFYVGSNEDFSTAALISFSRILEWFSHFNWHISPGQFFFFIGSVFVIGGMLWQTKSEWLVKFQKQHRDDITRQHKRLTRNPLIIKNSSSNNFGQTLRTVNDDKNFYSPKKSMIALKDEYRSGLIMLISLNILTLWVNITDIQNIWLNYANTEASMLWRDVHYGTYTLIFTIFMAMGVLLYYFRKNLNFYKKNKWLKIVAIAWMIQNMLLAFSVALRNIKYINYFGLTYKRIGVFIFLALVVYGLGTIIFKINHKKSTYYLFQHNAWTMYIVLILLTAVNWDVLITDYNLKSSTQPDKFYIAQKLSDKNLPILYKNSELFSGNLQRRPYSYENLLEQKRINFIYQKNSQSWLSWNLADHNTLLYLKKHKMQHLAD